MKEAVGRERSESGPVAGHRDLSPQIAWGVAGFSGMLALLLLVQQLRPVPAPEPARVLRAALESPVAGGFGGGHPTSSSNVAVSPDGLLVALVAGGQLWIRALSGVGATPIDGTEGADFPFWSPDSETLGFFAEGELRAVGRAGGAVRTICEAPEARGGSWATDGTILMAPGPRTGIHRVDAWGGEVRSVTEVDPALHSTHRWPQFLPNGEDFLFLATHHSDPRGSDNGIYLASLSGGRPRMLTAADSKPVVSSDRLLFLRHGNLLAQAFDPVQKALVGEAVPVASRVRYRGDLWDGVFDASRREVLAYETGPDPVGAQITLLDSLGTKEGELGAPDLIWDLRMSPAGDRLAVAAGSPDPVLWIYDLDSSRRVRGPSEMRFTRAPVWSPDGQHLAFAALGHEGRFEMYLASMEGAEGANLLVDSELDQIPTSWSSDGQWLVFDQGQPGATEIWALPMEGGGKPVPLVQSPPWAGEGQVSPDGRWLLYTSRESGTDQVYVASFPVADRRWQISAPGWARHGRWSPNGDTVYFSTAQGMLMEVELRRRRKDGGLDVGMPRMLFSYRRDDSLFRGHHGFFDPAPDGERFLLAQGPGSARQRGRIVLVVPWDGELSAASP